MPAVERPTRVTVVSPVREQEALTPLLRTWEARGEVRLVTWSHEVLHALPDLASGVDALLVVGPRHRAPSTVLPGPLVPASDHRLVPAGWLPATTPQAVARFARAAAQVHRRSQERFPRTTLAVLGQRAPRYDRLAARTLATAHAADQPAVTWTAYDLTRTDLAEHLHRGPGVAVYLGHGRPTGWVGYAGLRAHHLGPARARNHPRPVGAVLSLTCHTASRYRTGLSFAEALPLAGVCAATVAAVSRTRHQANARWAVRIAAEVGAAGSVGELVRKIALHDPHSTAYRIIGDPTAPLLDDPDFPAPSSPGHHHLTEEAS